MDMSDEWSRGLRAWASADANVRELWLFGSRADGHAKPESDVDLANRSTMTAYQKLVQSPSATPHASSDPITPSSLPQ